MKFLGKAGLVAAMFALAPLPARADVAFELAAAGAAAGEVVAVDINAAGEEQLRTLPGIGPARTQAIIAGRPYAATDDLVKRNILPKNVYDGVKDRIITKQK
ncbi:MAG TPA: helix-hairpin-helix domain-containing protein [Rhodospirillales bacterium]|nr:helix-hairpin-helix domain-containing protein [Rhodospirillales bacterium]